jgi:hypothetical protein
MIRDMPIDINDLARRGAASRIAELEQELAEIRAAFPDTVGPRKGSVRGRAGAGSAPAAPSVAEHEPSAQSRSGKKKRTMSAEARARISAAQKARWAKQKRAK